MHTFSICYTLIKYMFTKRVNEYMSKRRICKSDKRVHGPEEEQKLKVVSDSPGLQ